MNASPLLEARFMDNSTSLDYKFDDSELRGPCPFCFLESRPDTDLTINDLLPEQAVQQWQWWTEHQKHRKEHPA